MELGKDPGMNLFYTADRQEWRNWLTRHFETEADVWFVFPMKGSGEAALSYNDAVEEALCFGWIDSTIRHIDPLEHLITTDYVFPGDILKAVRQDPAAWEHYVSFSEPYKRIRIAYIDAARKRPDEFAKRLENFIRKTRENKLIVGYGGIDKYYR